ncbi:MAG TPA: hypothetical protein VD927_14485 [Chryseosolibacter sp.]|nr:hypothetical protein [Chryseosolibacter sp.]
MKKALAISLISGLSLTCGAQNSPLNVNSQTTQSAISITSTVGQGAALRLQRYNNSSDSYVFETGAYGDLRLHVNGNTNPPLIAFKTDGKIGVGTGSPRSALEVIGNQGLDWLESGNKGSGLVTIGSIGGNGSLFINTPTHNSYYSSGLGIDGSYDNTNRISQVNIKAFGVKYLSWSSVLAFHVSNGTNTLEAMRINNQGNVGIGTNDPKGFKLAVDGKVWATEVQVALTNPGPDYVFEPQYNLRPLDDLKAYIEQEKHLPEIPSAKEMEADGINVADMNMLLLKKVEELTLYLIALKEENDTIKAELERQNKVISAAQK